MKYDAVSDRIAIRRPTAADCDEYIALMQASAAFHHPWVDMPKTPERFAEYLKSRQSPSEDGFLICESATGAIAGVINLNCIVRRAFQSAYLGYCIGQPFARRGYMKEAMKLVTQYAFAEMKLHRLEANIQPANTASIALVQRCGFRKEGFSPRYLKILDEWRDHERWALLADEFASA
jgi:ribosomal-protein-alanine N-acetyltransferase